MKASVESDLSKAATKANARTVKSFDHSAFAAQFPFKKASSAGCPKYNYEVTKKCKIIIKKKPQ